MNKLHKNAVKSWVIARSIGSVIFLVISLLITYIMKHEFQIQWIIQGEKYILISILLIEILLIIDALVYPLLEYNQWVYELTDDKIDFTEGIFIKKRTIVPIVRIEHIKVNIGPINSKLGLADLEIFTAGGEHKIPNIEVKVAEEISDYLNKKIKQKVEEVHE
ncbi:PH domain-containing protein [Clostridium weizhouense]|nr:PH domain-containing protein [Clostridium weizhouense]